MKRNDRIWPIRTLIVALMLVAIFHVAASSAKATFGLRSPEDMDLPTLRPVV
jgi:hypothetical protein